MRVALVGGGAAAVSMLDSLLAAAENIDCELNIDIYEPGELARGVAFGPDLDCALVNTPNARISIRADEPAHFLDWLKRYPHYHRTSDTEPLVEAFAPRHVFGSYLRDHLDRCTRVAAARGWRVDVRREAVLAVMFERDEEYRVRTEQAVRDYSHIVVCIGPGSSADPYGLTAAPGYLSSPYPLNMRISAISAESHVLILGTGLTGVDAVLALLELEHRGRITMVSRQGRLPAVITRSENRNFKYLTMENVESELDCRKGIRPERIWELLKAELGVAGYDASLETSFLGPGASAADYLRHQFGRAEANPIQSMLRAISTPLAKLITSALHAAGRNDVLATYRTQLRSLQCPMPRQTAQTLLDALESGRVEIVPGVLDVRRTQSHFAVDAARSITDVDTVIDATRTAPARTKGISRHLVGSLLEKKIAYLDSFSALRVDPMSGRVLFPDGQPHSGLFAIGELTAGDVYWASSLPAVNRGADVVANTLVAKVSGNLAATSRGYRG